MKARQCGGAIERDRAANAARCGHGILVEKEDDKACHGERGRIVAATRQRHAGMAHSLRLIALVEATAHVAYFHAP